jgi:hypothetical protein
MDKEPKYHRSGMATQTRAILAEFYRDFVQPDTERVLREV